MSGGKASVQCLLCENIFVVKDLLEHIHGHYQYKPQKCNNCGFECVYRNELDQHTFEYDHTGSTYIDPFKQSLVDSLNENTLFAAKHGKEELMKINNLTSLSIAPTPKLPSIRTQSQENQKKYRPPPPIPTRSRVIPLPEITSSPSDEEEEPRPTQRSASRPVANGRSDNLSHTDSVRIQRNKPDEEQWESEEYEKEMEKLRSDSEKYANCQLCHETIRINLAVRIEHIREKHMDGVKMKNGSYPFELLDQRTQKAFPGLESNCLHCRECARKKDFRKIQTTAGRITHTIDYHNEFFPTLKCPMNGCRFESYNADNFKPHFENAHGPLLTLRKFLEEHDFPSKLVKHRRRVEDVSRLLFVMDFPGQEGTSQHKAIEFDEDAAIAEEWRKLMNPTKKRRASSSSSSEDSSSDDDKPSTTKKQLKKKKVEKIVIRRSDGGEKSDDGEEKGSKRENKDVSMTMDKKENVNSDDDNRSIKVSAASPSVSTISSSGGKSSNSKTPLQQKHQYRHPLAVSSHKISLSRDEEKVSVPRIQQRLTTWPGVGRRSGNVIKRDVKGIVKCFNVERGFGFIIRDDTKEARFFLRCDCGEEVQSDKHLRNNKCKIANYTLIRRGDGPILTFHDTKCDGRKFTLHKFDEK